MIKYFKVNDGENSICCKIYCNDYRSINKMILFCHGFGGHKDTKSTEKFALRVLSKYKNVGLITFDLPSHGDDVKRYLVARYCIVYLNSVINHINQTWSNPVLYGYAVSFGGYLMLKYINEYTNPFYRLALRCPTIKMYEVMTEVILSDKEKENIQRGRDVPVGFDRKVTINNKFICDLQCNNISNIDYTEEIGKILIIHGTNDEIVDYKVSRDFAENNLIEFLPIEGADHRFQNPDHMEKAIKEIIKFYEFKKR